MTVKQINEFLHKIEERFFSNTNQVKRLVVLATIALVLAVATFGGYYYFDRYYRPQPEIAKMSVEQAEKAVAEDAQDPEKRLTLAETYMINNRYEDAIAQAQEVMRVYPENQHAWLVLGIANALGGHPAEAVSPLSMFLEANKDAEMPGLNKAMQSAAYYLGDSYLQLGQPANAVDPLEKAVVWSQTDADAMYKLGMAYLGVQSYDQAVVMFMNATTFVPDYKEAYQGLAAAYEALNQPAYADYARGMEAFSDKNYKGALDMLLKSAQATPDFAPAFAGLGMTYEAMNDLENAKSSYEAAVKLDPNNFSASTGLDRVTTLLNK